MIALVISLPVVVAELEVVGIVDVVVAVDWDEGAPIVLMLAFSSTNARN